MSNGLGWLIWMGILLVPPYRVLGGGILRRNWCEGFKISDLFLFLYAEDGVLHMTSLCDSKLT